MEPSVNHRIVKTMKSLVDAIDSAGGSPDLKYVFELTVFDFIMKIAGPNSIEFQFVGNQNKTIPTGRTGNVE